MADTMTAHEENSSSQENTEQTRVKCLIADAAAFIKNVPLDNVAERVFTLKDVVNEIRDATTRQRLAVLPYELEFREPSTESISFVSEFAKKTGDYRSLSATDLRVIALTYQLEKEFCDATHIRLKPKQEVTYIQRSYGPLNKVVGFYSSSKEAANKNDDASESDQVMAETGTNKDIDRLTQSTEDATACETPADDTVEDRPIEEGDPALGLPGDDGVQECTTSDNGDEEQDDDSDDGGGWITPSNVKAAKTSMGFKDDIELQGHNASTVCLTTDFAMQNVLIQMGLHVVSVDGMLVRQARSYVLKCYGCSKVTSETEREFCPSCGNKTLNKLAVTVAEDGTVQYHLQKRRKPFNIRGLKYSLPLPKGGRHSNNVVLCEDQRKAPRNMPRKTDAINPMDDDYVARSSPFSQTDVNSRAFSLGLHLHNGKSRRINPNEGKKKTGKRR